MKQTQYLCVIWLWTRNRHEDITMHTYITTYMLVYCYVYIAVPIRASQYRVCNKPYVGLNNLVKRTFLFASVSKILMHWKNGLNFACSIFQLNFYENVLDICLLRSHFTTALFEAMALLWPDARSSAELMTTWLNGVFMGPYSQF